MPSATKYGKQQGIIPQEWAKVGHLCDLGNSQLIWSWIVANVDVQNISEISQLAVTVGVSGDTGFPNEG